LTREYRQREQKQIKELKERLLPSAWASELDPVVLTFEANRVYKGAVGKRQEIEMAISSSSNSSEPRNSENAIVPAPSMKPFDLEGAGRAPSYRGYPA
jgi:hypothetical protein